MKAGFYHLQKWPLEHTLPRLLQKIFAAGLKAVVMVDTPERIDSLSHVIWTYDQDSFIPHGSEKDGFAQEQPIWLTCKEENPNNATALVLTSGMETSQIASFARVFDIFDGNDEEALKAARKRYKACKEMGAEISYYQQNENGGWVEKK